MLKKGFILIGFIIILIILSILFSMSLPNNLPITTTKKILINKYIKSNGTHCLILKDISTNLYSIHNTLDNSKMLKIYYENNIGDTLIF